MRTLGLLSDAPYFLSRKTIYMNITHSCIFKKNMGIMLFVNFREVLPSFQIFHLLDFYLEELELSD